MIHYCNSSYLVFRYVVTKGYGWTPNTVPKFPNEDSQGIYAVSSEIEIKNSLKGIINTMIKKGKKIGLLLSGGIDSAILAALLPQNVECYTINFVDGIDEAKSASVYTDKLNKTHYTITITVDDYMAEIEGLMKYKKAPLHAIEAALSIAARKMKEDGVEIVVVGNGADSTFGGMDKLLSKDWTKKEFIERYTFIKPESV